MMKSSAFSAAIVLGILLGAGQALAAAPTVSVETQVPNAVQITVNGDPNSAIQLFVANPSQYVDTIGSTNYAGHFSASFAPTAYNIPGGTAVYAVVNNQSSAVVSWPYGVTVTPLPPMSPPVTTGTEMSLSQNSSSLTVGQSQTLAVYGNGSYYIYNNSNSSAVTATLGSNSIMLYALSAGNSTIMICENDGQCVSLNVNVTSPVVYNYPTYYNNYYQNTYVPPVTYVNYQPPVTYQQPIIYQQPVIYQQPIIYQQPQVATVYYAPVVQAIQTHIFRPVSTFFSSVARSWRRF